MLQDAVHDEQIKHPWLTVSQRADRSQVAVELPWQSSAIPPVLWMDRFGEGADRPTLGAFSSALRAAGLFDNRSIELPGAVIALPAGHRLLECFRSEVRGHYSRAGLAEYDYPCLAPLAAFDTFNEVFPSKDRVLWAATQADMSRGSPRAVLLPTGEPIIYSHWAKFIRHAGQLPIEMFRHTRFFRPWSTSDTGRGIFNLSEAADMFEFHCCYEPLAVEAASHRLFAMLRGLLDALCVPVLWSTRPPWTNHAAVSLATVGGDSPMPSGGTLQIATLYNQGDVFSRRFGIRYRSEGGSVLHTHHLVGAVSRRLLLAHLLHGLCTDGAFITHPTISPEQISVVIRPSTLDSAETASSLVEALRGRGLRVVVNVAEDAKELARLTRRGPRLLVPLVVVLQGRRRSGDLVRLFIKRSDDASEISATYPSFSEITTDIVTAAMSDITSAFQQRANLHLSKRCIETHDVNATREVLRERKVAVCPMEFSAEAIKLVTSWNQGEVLGFTQGTEPASCIALGRASDTLAYVSPRA